MKATRKTIPNLIEKREEFSNTSGTLKAVKPSRPGIFDIYNSDDNQLNETEKSRMRIDAGREWGGIVYIILSYGIPIAWETRRGHVYKVAQTFTQTTGVHQGMLYLFHAKGQ